MRPIKFRAWMASPGQLVYESDMWGEQQFLGVLDGCAYFRWEHGFSDYPETDHELVEAEIMQYTGLKDKNGVEIYEGDIVKGSNGIATIQWGDRIFGFTFKWLDKDSGNVLRNDLGEFEVIGNIYENKDLLK